MYHESQRVKRLTHGGKDVQFCYTMLNQVSRSFAVVIQQLPAELRDAVCVFYLVLRALDSIEDDMAFPEDKKLPLLRSLHHHVGDTCALSRCMRRCTGQSAEPAAMLLVDKHKQVCHRALTHRALAHCANCDVTRSPCIAWNH